MGDRHAECAQALEASDYQRRGAGLPRRLPALHTRPLAGDVLAEEVEFTGVREDIFRRLRNSEYFLFIDFKRELIGDGYHRGSRQSEFLKSGRAEKISIQP